MAKPAAAVVKTELFTAAQVAKFRKVLPGVNITKGEASATTKHNITSKYYNRAKFAVKHAGGSDALAAHLGREVFREAGAQYIAYAPSAEQTKVAAKAGKAAAAKVGKAAAMKVGKNVRATVGKAARAKGGRAMKVAMKK